jgi:hypothetical protein
MGGILFVLLMTGLISKVQYGLCKLAENTPPIETNRQECKTSQNIQTLNYKDLVKYIKDARQRNEINYGEEYSCFEGTQANNFLNINNKELDLIRPLVLPRHKQKIVTHVRRSSDNGKYGRYVKGYVSRGLKIRQKKCTKSICKKIKTKDKWELLCGEYKVISEIYERKLL